MAPLTELFIRKKHYWLALLGVLLAAAFRYALGPIVGELIPVVVFTLPVLVAAIYGGFGPGFFATVISVVISAYLFVAPNFSFGVMKVAGAVSLLVFLIIGSAISLLGEKLKRLQNRAEEQARALSAENEAKDEFLAMLAHELRNPLAGISAAAELLKVGCPDEKRLSYVGAVITRQVGHMVHLVDDLLDVSRLSRGLVTIDKRPVDMNAVVHDAVSQTQALFDKRAHKLTLELPTEPAFVLGDFVRLVQVVANLLGNAAKYTLEGGRIVLAMQTRQDTIEVRIEDNGLGLAPELLPRVFEPFVQGKRKADRSEGGLGLGLALVRKITELHGGSVRAESEGQGHGSQFTLRLPRWQKSAGFHLPEPASQQSRIRLDNPAERSLHVMVVEDNPDAAFGLSSLLENEGHKVAVAFNSEQALHLAHAQPFDVLLLDIGLPDADGYELLPMLRSVPSLAGAAFIAVSGYGKEEDRKRSIAAGFQCHFVKPVDMTELSQVLRRILRKG